MTTLKRTFATLLVLCAASASAHAGKKQKAEAKQHLEKAMTAHQAGNFDEALTELEAAYKLDPDPEDLYALGQVYSKLGKCTEATAYYNKYLAKKKKSPDVANVVDQAINACTPAPGTVVNSTAPEPTPTGTEPTPSTTSSTPTTTEPVPTTTEPATSAPTAAVAPVPPAPGPAADHPWYKDKLGDALVAAGIVSGVAGIVVYSSASSDLDSAEKQTTLAQYQSMVDSAHTDRTISVVLIGGGVALIGAGVVRYMLREHGESHSAVAVAPTHGGGLVTWMGGF
jgi:tetratricopeptide (TPR) repeat protein